MWEIWSEGYIVSGDSSEATYHGNYEGETFKEAVETWIKTLSPNSAPVVDLENLSFWGCRLFDNERDARKSFG